jgi:hypothetical protein
MRLSEFLGRVQRRIPVARRAQRILRHDDLRNLRRLEPVSSVFGLDRGTPIDRFYIERFLSANAAAIQGRVLEVGDNRYTRQFGEGVQVSDVLHVQAGKGVTLVGDLETGTGLPLQAFDCVILTQTLNCVFELASAASHLQQILRPGGVALVTVPGISQISEFDMTRWGEFWRFTPAALERLLAHAFGSSVDCHSFGNVLSSAAFLYGLAAEELTATELEQNDARYPLVVTARATRSKEG